MNYAQKNIARFGIALLNVFLSIVEKRISLDLAMGGGQPCRLRKDEKMIVFQKNVESPFIH